MIESRKGTQGASTPLGAVVFLIVGVVAVLALGALLVRQVGEETEGLADAASQLIEDAQAPDEPPAAPETPDVSQPDGATPYVPPVPEDATPWPEPDAASAFQHTVARCVPDLRGFAEDVRLLAVDASPKNVDFVLESAGVPGRFVRLACTWDGASFSLVDQGRVIVPPMVGDPAKLPLVLLDPAQFDAAWFAARIDAARRILDRSTAEVRRVETSYVAGHGVLTRVRVGDADQTWDVVLATDDRSKRADTPFPQVERLVDMTPDAALRGYRDTGTTNWSVGVADTVDQMRSRFFEPSDRLKALTITQNSVTGHVVPAKGSGYRQVVVDHESDVTAQDVPAPSDTHCAKPFTLADARAALDAAIAERGETLEAFEAHDFESAVYDCAMTTAPQWRFDGG